MMKNLQQKLLSIPCHFSWECLQQSNAGRTVQMNIKDLEEHVQSGAIQGTEIESFNLMGFYKTQQKCFEEGRRYFEEALKNSETEDEIIVSLGCLAWLAWKEQDSGSSSCTQAIEKIDEVLRIRGGRSPEDIPEVMGEKAFAIANSGFTEKGFKEALDCVNKALQKRPDNVMYKYSKAIIMKQLYYKKHAENKNSNDDAVKMEQIWKEVLTSFRGNDRYSVLYGQALVQFAIFLHYINWDFGASGKPYAEEAERVAGSSQIVMRNIANFYNRSAGKNICQLEKAEEILERILTSKPDGAYKESTLLGSVLLKKYRIRGHPEAFDKAEKYLRKSWDVNRKYIQLAVDLVRLYQMKYDKFEDDCALVEAENVIREIFPYMDSVENYAKAIFYSGYGKFLKKYGAKLAPFHHQLAGSGNNSDGSGRSTKVERAVAFLHEYTQNKDEDKLLQAEKMFMEIQWEDLTDSVKADFHQEFAAFLQNHSRDLAFCYFKKSLECNPQQRRSNAYEPLEELANEIKASSDTEEQMKGHRTLEWLQNL